MKITAVLIFICAMQVNAKVFSQKLITLDVKNMPVGKVLDEIQAQSGFDIFYNQAMLDHTKNVTVSIKNASIEDALKASLAGQPLDFRIVAQTVSIRKKLETATKNSGATNFIDINGQVMNEKGEPLDKASVEIKGEKRGAYTNSNGFFELKHVDENASILISFSGYKEKEVEIHGRINISITLLQENSSLDKVQVIAYGSTTQRYTTGNVTTITSKEIEEQPISNPLAALEGRVPGLYITQSTGIPGGAFNVQIRGQNSIQNGNDPFYVIDGVPYTSQMLPNLGSNILQNSIGNNNGAGSPMNFINPSDIESITVLKDADATAIYGSRGANGAILITTKKGIPGNTQFNVNIFSGVGKAPLKVNWLSTPQYLKMRRESFYNDSIADPQSYNPPDQYSAPDLVVWDTTSYTDWQKALIGGSAKFNDAQLSISGGNNTTQFLIAGGVHDESTVFHTDSKDQKVSLHINLTNSSNDKRFKISFSANYLNDVSSLPSIDLVNFITSPPDAPAPYNPDGSLNWANSTWPGGNPYSYLSQKYNCRTNNIVGNTILSYNIIKGLDVLSSFGYTNMQIHEISTTPISSQNPAYLPTGSSSFTNNEIQSWIIEPQLTYHFKVEKSKVEILVGTTFQKNSNEGEILAASGYNSDILLENPQASSHVSIQSQTSSIYKYNAIFSRVNYNYLNKYILNFNWRRDGSSRFGPQNKFHNFGSIGAAWIFSNENLFKNSLPIFSFGKIRASYGTTGNDQIGDYSFYDLFATTRYSYQNTVGLSPSSLYNPELEWELTKKFEGGFDIGFLHDRILLNTSYYSNKSSNQLLSYSLPTLTGFQSIPNNFPATVQNYGWEFFLNTTNIKSKDFSWTTSFNFSQPKNRLIAFPNLNASPYQYSLIIGQPVTTREVYNFAGVNDSTGIYQFLSSKGTKVYSPNFTSDKTSLINTAPKYFGGLKNTFNYKDFQFEFFFTFTKQLGPNIVFQPASAPGSFYVSNEPQSVLSRWQKPGDNAEFEQYTQSFSSLSHSGYRYASQSNVAFTDASFIRLKNISISYQLPMSWNKKLHLQSCNIYIHAQNLLTITNYKGLDPESQSLYSLPPLKVFTAGIQFSF